MFQTIAALACKSASLIETETSMVIYAIWIVGAASSRDDRMIAEVQLFFAAGSRSHEESRYAGVVSYVSSRSRLDNLQPARRSASVYSFEYSVDLRFSLCL